MAPSPPLSETSGLYIDQIDTYPMDIDSHQIAPFVQLSNLPPKGKIHSLIREESRAIPIPGRAQSHDDIRMLRGTPPRSPASGRYSPSRYIICGSPGSPPIGHYGPHLIAGAGSSGSSNAFSYSQVVSPLSSSVPTGGGGSNRLANWKCPLTKQKKKTKIAWECLQKSNSLLNAPLLLEPIACRNDDLRLIIFICTMSLATYLL